MRKIVILCVFLVTINTFILGKQTIIMSSTPSNDYHRSFGNYIEINEGEQFSVSCRDDFSEPVTFEPSYLENNAGFSTTRFEDMIVLGVSNGLVLRNMEAQVFDSGRYFCHREKDITLNMSIHVFVRGDSFFVPKKSAQIEVTDKWVIVPCTSTALDTDVEILWDGEPFKADYRPTEGFRVLASSLKANTTVFECRHKKSGNTIAFTVHSSIPRTFPAATTTPSTTTSTAESTTTTPTSTTRTTVSSTTKPEKVHGNGFWPMVFLAVGIAIIASIVAIYLYKKPDSARTCQTVRARLGSHGDLIEIDQNEL